MAGIYQEAAAAVTDGAKFRVDFQSRSLKLNGKYIIQDGRYEGELGVLPCSGDEFFSKLEELYDRYKRSVPSERSEGKSRQYFFALPEKDLDDEAMLYGERRDKAQIELELYVLCQILHGLEWDSATMGSWFWQSKADKDLVILRQWVEPDKQSITNKLTKQHEKREKGYMPSMRCGVRHAGKRFDCSSRGRDRR